MINLDFTGQTILITGAASGMGLEEAKLLASYGAEVWMADLRLDTVKSSVERIRKGQQVPGPLRPLELDVTDPKSWDSALAKIDSASGKLDGLINNAGKSLRKGFQETTIEEWNSIISVNMDGVFFGTKLAYPLLLKGKSPSIVNISSIAGTLGYFAPGYGASKWAIRGLSKCAALEYSTDGIRVNTVCPGLVESPLLNSGTKEFVEESLKAIPLNRVAKPLEVAQTVAFLLHEASAYITGADIVVDGGLTSAGIYKQITERLASY